MKIVHKRYPRLELPGRTVQWLRFYASNAAGMGSIPSWETKIPHAAQHPPSPTAPAKEKDNAGTKKKRWKLLGRVWLFVTHGL